MKKTLVILTLVLVLLLTSINAHHAPGHGGCCCDPIQGASQFSDPSECPAGYATTPPPTNLGETCEDLCNTAGIPPPQQPPPGQQPPPTQTTGCGSQGYAPKPENLEASDIKSEKVIQLDFTLECPVDSLTISRCEGQGCTNFNEIDQVVPTTIHIDSSEDLEWSKYYTYSIVANYALQGETSSAATVSEKLGDLECWNNLSERFCISEFYYEGFEEYLKEFGYLNTPASNFVANFQQSVVSTFNARFNRAWTCNANNELQTTPISCPSGEVCVSDEKGVRCIAPQPCDQGGIFGLYHTIGSCEGTGTSTYCFLDRSSSHADSCFQCSQRMSCYDYKSKGTCERDPCFAGTCSWRDIYGGVGIGVCIDETKSNCENCDKEGAAGMDNLASSNEVFDRCSNIKAQGLSTSEFPCFFNKNKGTGVGCEDAKCSDYSPSQCRSPLGGITLSSDNSILTLSADACGVGVCQYDFDIGCAKNADGSKDDDWDDCHGLSGDPREACELDYIPPETSLITTGGFGRIDYINIKLFDKTSRQDPGGEKQGEEGYITYLCIINDQEDCTAADDFPIVTNATQLNVNDLTLQEGARVIGTFQEGLNTIKFYSKDASRNLEVVKALNIYACNLCSGPKPLSIEIVPGREIDGTFYTSSITPTIKVNLNEPSEITDKSLRQGSQEIPLAQTPSSGFNLNYEIRPSQPLSEGTYTFEVHAKDQNEVFMDLPSSLRIIVDTTPPTVIVTPPTNQVINQTPILIKLQFSEKVTTDIKLKERLFVDKYALRRVVRSLNGLLTSPDNTTFSGSIANLNDGVERILIRAEDYATNLLDLVSVFFIGKDVPKMRLKHPSWGVSSTYTFDLVVETTSHALCKYVYDAPTAPSFSDFDVFSNFDTTNSFEHVKYGFSLPPDDREHLLHVYCKKDDHEIQETFTLSIDDEAPEIENAFASPETIVEPLYPGQKIYVTTLKVQINEPGFCKYSNQTSDFKNMEWTFPGFEEIPKKSHSIEINVSEEKAYTYMVNCIDLAETETGPENIEFDVDLSQEFKVISHTPPFFNSTTITLALETNKRSYCYFGEDSNAITECLGNCSFGRSHTHELTVPSFGNYTYYVQCNTAGLGELSKVMEINFLVGDYIPEAQCTVNSDCGAGYCNFGICSSEPLPCFDGMLTGTETDIDCGGSCPNKCAEQQNCVSNLDCQNGLNCVNSACSTQPIIGDSDNDGVFDDLDSCPGTPRRESVDEFGCSDSQRDSDNDGMPDSWELEFGLDTNNPLDASEDIDGDGLTNLEEYRNKTNPLEEDTDGDKWNDKKELDKGYDPLDPESHPKSSFIAFLWVLLIIALLAAAGTGGYYLLKLYKQGRGKKPSPMPVRSIIKPASRPTIIKKPDGGSRLASLRNVAKGANKEEQKDWLTFGQLEGIVHGSLTSGEKRGIAKKLKLLGEGKLGVAEKDKLFKKLKITSEYYKRHKSDIEKEFQGSSDSKR